VLAKWSVMGQLECGTPDRPDCFVPAADQHQGLAEPGSVLPLFGELRAQGRMSTGRSRRSQSQELLHRSWDASGSRGHSPASAAPRAPPPLEGARFCGLAFEASHRTTRPRGGSSHNRRQYQACNTGPVDCRVRAARTLGWRRQNPSRPPADLLVRGRMSHRGRGIVRGVLSTGADYCVYAHTPAHTPLWPPWGRVAFEISPGDVQRTKV
jgi:hypothetical protein